MKTLLFLTYRMQAGFGVDVVVANLARRLRPLGVNVVVGCLENDGSYSDIDVRPIADTLEAAVALASNLTPHAIVAHTSPFFEMLPHLQRHWPSWAWEHGDPTPEFFEHDQKERQRIKANKEQHCYPHIQGVLAISQFIRSDIRFPAAHVVYNGCDHVPDMAAKGQEELSMSPKTPLRIGTLMRLGAGEAKYKGGNLFRTLCDLIKQRQIDAEFCVMGRGTAQDAKAFRRAGMRVHLNAAPDDKWQYLRDLDIFISCSQWEGFNLPLVEAQALGTMGLAFDTGAHPEVTPFILSSLPDAVALVEACAVDRHLLLNHSRLSWHFVRRRFGWQRAAQELRDYVLGNAA